MEISSAKFIISNTDPTKCPSEYIPEYAFIGRSNVGKSSLINMLVDNRKLAKTSNNPGKTQLINHFKINEQWFLVDLPGYGYAKVSKNNRKEFQKIITSYLKKRKQLVNIFVLIDIRHSPMKIDLEFMEWINNEQLPFSLVFTKADKLKTPLARKKHIDIYIEKMFEYGWVNIPPYFITSYTQSIGKNEILNYINQINKSL